MRIINPQVRADIGAGHGLRLNLGSGKRNRPGFYNVDHLPLPGVDIVANLNEPLDDLPDNSVDEIYSRHTLEHVANLLPLLSDIHRISRPRARIEIIVPHFSNSYSFSDPTHVRVFGLYSFFYFCDEPDQPLRKVPNFYLTQRFRVASVRFTMQKHSLVDRMVHSWLQKLINRRYSRQDWYERKMCRWFPVSSVRYVLYPKKQGLAA
jgi:hypothetical protein